MLYKIVKLKVKILQNCQQFGQTASLGFFLFFSRCKPQNAQIYVYSDIFYKADASFWLSYRACGSDPVPTMGGDRHWFLDC